MLDINDRDSHLEMGIKNNLQRNFNMLILV